MKLVQVFATAAAVAFLASCSCCNCSNGSSEVNDSIVAAQKDSIAKDSVVKAEKVAKRAAAVEAGEELSAAIDTLPEAKQIFGRISKIDGNAVSVDLRGKDTTVVVSVPNVDELMEGAPVRIAYTTDAEGNNVASEARVPRRYRMLLGKWATEGDAISFELRRRNHARSINKANKKANIEYKGWFATRDSIEFEFVPAGQKISFFDKWHVAELDSNHLLLVKDDNAKYDMHRVDSNED